MSRSTHVNVFHKYPATTMPRAGMIIGSQPSRRNPSESLPRELRRKDSIILRLRQKNSGLCGNDAKNQDERHWPRQPISPKCEDSRQTFPTIFWNIRQNALLLPAKKRTDDLFTMIATTNYRLQWPMFHPDFYSCFTTFYNHRNETELRD